MDRFEAVLQQSEVRSRKLTSQEALQLANTPGRRSIGRSGLTTEFTIAERVRNGWKKWLTGVQLPEFGTLTLRPYHGKNCRDRKCDGLTRRGSLNCRVPGVQKTQKLVDTFRKLCSGSFVVEELGTRKGRRHFHYLADGSTTDRWSEHYCLRELAERSHTHHDVGWNAVGFWKRFAGGVDNTIVESYSRAIDYVLKDINDEDETRVWFG